MYLWSKLSGAKWADAWEERFSGNPNFVIEYIKGAKSVRLQVFCSDEKEAKAISQQFGGTIRKVRDVEWNKVPEPPKPLKVRDVFFVSAETDPKRLEAIKIENGKRQVIVIPPEMAFGTGDHATTSTCMRLLVDISRERKGQRWSCADLGTGSGLLAIGAAKLGSSKVWACDYDPFAVAVAKRNAERNQTLNIEFVELDVLQWKPRKQGYDVVMANLFSTILIEAWPTIAKTMNQGCDLVVSGILASQAWEVFEAAAKEGIGFHKIIKKGKWVSARGGWFEDIAKNS